MQVLFDDNNTINTNSGLVDLNELLKSPNIKLTKTVYVPYHSFYAYPGQHPFGDCNCSQLLVLEEN